MLTSMALIFHSEGPIFKGTGPTDGRFSHPQQTGSSPLASNAHGWGDIYIAGHSMSSTLLQIVAKCCFQDPDSWVLTLELHRFTLATNSCDGSIVWKDDLNFLLHFLLQPKKPNIPANIQSLSPHHFLLDKEHVLRWLVEEVPPSCHWYGMCVAYQCGNSHQSIPPWQYGILLCCHSPQL